MDPEAGCPWSQACWLSLESLLLTGWQEQKRVSHNKLTSNFLSALSSYYDQLHYNDAEGPSLPNGTIGYFYIATMKFLTGRFHVPVHLFSDRSQMTSKYDKTCSATLGHRLVSFIVLFYIIEKQKWLLMTSSVRLLSNRS